ncbi:MAG: class I tRNA ligase family protein [Candidatus Roizmanbacteria bacterium]|nr:class I tRNA ligase family protein [Candidatus Roizmanbacteria bacterium]
MKRTIETTPNFPVIEHKWLEYWKTHNIQEKYLSKNNTSIKRFSYIDGPITANNPMGVHHGWGRSYKDLWQKFHNLLGYKQRFQNGFDCQGLWVEVEVEKELGIKNKKQIEELVPGDKKASIAKFVMLCKERVKKYAAIQTEQSKRLGYFMDWENSYFTMSNENNYMIWYYLKKCFDYGWIYKGHESVPWCPRCETAISQHEMLTEDYKDVTHETIYLKLKVTGKNKEFFLIWTTTPWTIPANIAIAVDAKLDYALVEGMSGDYFWIAKDSVERVFKKVYKRIVRVASGASLVGMTYSGPFDALPAVREVAQHNPKTFHTVIATDDTILPISTSEGTGQVHTAVSAGVEDFKLGKKYSLPMIPVIGDNADYLPNLGFLSGKNAKKNPRIILDYLEEQDKMGNSCVFSIEKFKHRYPACWRCKTELVWKVADEWYIAMDKPALVKGKIADETDTLRQRMITIAKNIKWTPSFGLSRELDWLNNMHDWLISKKNRYWGLSLPIYECSSCKMFEVLGSEDELENRAVHGWKTFEGHTPHKPWIDDVKIKCSHCGKTISRIPDVGNPWLDAGIVPYSTLIDPKTNKASYRTDKKYWKQWFPADSISESFPGQFKNWFYALIAMSAGLENTEPFRHVLGYATLLDEHGKPMHKSSGNMIEFMEGADKMGVDVMRWIYARQDPKKNLLFGYTKASEVKRAFHLPLWNTFKFYLTYTELDSWKKPSNSNITEHLASSHLSLLDKWILSRLVNTIEKVYRNLNAYKPSAASEAIEGLVLDVSQWYIRLSRNRTWTGSTNIEDKNAFYSTLFTVLHTVTILISAFLPFFSEELYQVISGEKASVHLENWPQLSKHWRDTQLEQDMVLLRTLAEAGHSQRKEKQLKVRQPLASVHFTLPKGSLTIPQNIKEYQEYLCIELNVKKVEFSEKSTSQICAELDTSLTDELKKEGAVRDIIRSIQQLRKDQSCSITEHIDITIPSVSPQYQTYIAQRVLADSVIIGEKIAIFKKK